MKLSFPAFQRLRWKLMLPYIFTIPLVMLIIQIIVIVASIIIIELFYISSFVLYYAQQSADHARPFFVHNGIADSEELTMWLNMPPASAIQTYQPDFVVIVNMQGSVLASTAEKNVPTRTSVRTKLDSRANADFQQLVTGKVDHGLVSQSADGAVIAIAPIFGKNKRIVGALVENTGPQLAMRETRFWLVYYIPTILFSSLFFVVFAGIAGLIGGFFTARNLTRRFQQLSLAADNWSRGDFTLFTLDSSKDELGQLARTLNRMAEQLQHLLQARQKLAVLEERHRLARDLHDSVKQHIFVIALQVGSARIQLQSRFGEGGSLIQNYLVEAERVLLEVQQELITLIRELRPLALEGKGLTHALQDFITQWTRQTTIIVDMQVTGKQDLSPLAEEALFRVSQEVFANIARHSYATHVQFNLAYEQEQVILTIVDNGRGFNNSSEDYRAGFGLTSIRERMKALGGDVSIISSPDGTKVVATFHADERS